jgi:hypothetical protein
MMMIKVLCLSILICFSRFSFGQESIKEQADSTQNSYAILQVDWSTKKMHLLYEDGSGKVFSEGNIFKSYSVDERINLLMKRFSALRKEGYNLIDSFEQQGLNCFVFQKRIVL